MNNYVLLLLLLAGTLLLFGCAGKYAAAKEKQGSDASSSAQPGNPEAIGGPPTTLTESDLALFEDADSVPELSDLPMDDGS